MTIIQKQLLLAFMDCLPVEGVDGVWGPQSAAATVKAQQMLGIRDDGVWGDQTDAAIREYVYNGQELKEPEMTETFWDNIRYWSREEFRCQCGGKYCSGFPAEPDQKLVELVDDIRHEAGRPGHRSSGLRCTTWNAIQGGVSNSKHMSGKALDFYIEGLSGAQLLALAQKDPRTSYAYIIDGQFVHVDVK
jgi:hypothetical protein